MFLQKPLPWDVNPRDVAPEWGWIWKHRHIFVPFWENGGLPFAYGPDDFGTLVNEADWQDTAVGPGIDCPGSDDYVTFTRNFFPDGEGTVFIAFIPDIVGATNQILCYESDGTDSDHNGFGGTGSIREIHLGLAGGLAEFTYQDGAAADDQIRIAEASSTLVVGSVNTMVATWKDGGTHFLYVNGIERASGASAAPYDGIAPTVIRWGAPGDLSANREFNGKILKHYSLTKQLPGSIIADLHRGFSGPFRMRDEVGVVVGLSVVFTSANLALHHSGAADIGGAIGAALTDDALNNLWDDVSSGDATSGDTEYRCHYTKNTHGSLSVANVKAEIAAQPAESSLEIGLGAAGKNGTETEVANEDTSPAGVSFGTAALDFGTLAAGDFYPFWEKRIVGAGAGAATPDSGVLRISADDPN